MANFNYVSPSAEEKAKLLNALVYNKVFTSMQIPIGEEERITQIFISLTLMEQEYLETLADMMVEGSVMYEYLEEASPLAINGFPSFFSFRIITKADFVPIVDEAVKIRKERDAAVQRYVENDHAGD